MLGDDVGYVDAGEVEGVVGIDRVPVAIFSIAGLRVKSVVPTGEFHLGLMRDLIRDDL